MGRWLEHTVTSNIDAPVERVWAVWSDLDAMPLWMSWIESVKTVEEETKILPDLTEWTLAANGFRFKWKARISERIDAQKLKWESVGGLPTKGAVRFYSEELNHTVVKLTVSYELPKVLAPLMEANILGGMVNKELQANLDRFRDLVESGYRTAI
ncbi:SRPBCC family protein [Prochlorococcus sp. MIT 1341]|uniref:SRPBCC family protein n=1 Tax=Prochlorococcus sp. MIT 1341 TaxID=3096221 RepID=UPI002A75821D|nr:SRPBCC family protein [Prochlorococcus sp. MIT 1341]